MLQYSFMQNAFIVSIFISILCPVIGMFLVLKRHSMIGDTLSHSSLAGITLGLMLGRNPVISAFAFTSFFGVLMEFLRNYFKKYSELILSVVLSISVGTAITIISTGNAHANVESFLFGSILTVTKQDLTSIILLCFITVILLAIFYHKLMFITFDEDGAIVSGIKVRTINYIFSVLVASTISISVRITGILVLSSLITLPVAAALQFKRGFKATLIASVFLSFIEILSGIFISYYIGAAPGGVTALLAAFILIIVILLKQLPQLYLKIRASK